MRADLLMPPRRRRPSDRVSIDRTINIHACGARTIAIRELCI